MNKTIATLTASAAMLAAAPATAQTFVIVVGKAPSTEETVIVAADMDGAIETAIERACGKPSLRDLKGWVLYEQCLETAEVERATELVAESETGQAEQPVTIALR